MKSNERNPHNETPSQANSTPQGNGQASVPPVTPSAARAERAENAGYNDGYVQGRVVENVRENRRHERDNENTSRGLLLGIILASLVALVGGALYYASQRDSASSPAIAPAPEQPQAEPAPTRTIERERTIIERVIPGTPDTSGEAEETAPEPAQPAPNINITVPNSQTQEAPVEQPAAAPVSPPNINITMPEINQESTPAPAEPTTPAVENQETPEPEASPAPESAEPANDSGLTIPAN